MDTSQIAPMVVSVLVPVAPFLKKAGEEIAKQIGKDLWVKLKSLYEAIKQKFESDKDEKAQQALNLFTQDPEAFGSALEVVLSRKVAEDPSFREMLKNLISEVQEFEVEGRQVALGSYIAQAIGHSTATVQVNERANEPNPEDK